MMSCASPWLHTDGPRECSRCGPAHAPGCAFQILSFSRQGCHYGGLCLLSVTVLFMVLSKKAMWGHTRDACIRGTWVESEGGGGVLLFPILSNMPGISRQPVNMMTEPIFAIWKMSGLIPFKLHSLDTPTRLLKKISIVLVRPQHVVCHASFSAAQSDWSD